MNRQEDLSKVFDRTWAANHNDVAKRGREREKKFINKMFGVKESNASNNSSTPSDRINNLQKNINGMGNFERQNRVNNIIKKWK